MSKKELQNKFAYRRSTLGHIASFRPIVISEPLCTIVMKRGRLAVNPHPVTWGGHFDPSHASLFSLYTKLLIPRLFAFKIAFVGLCLSPLQKN